MSKDESSTNIIKGRFALSNKKQTSQPDPAPKTLDNETAPADLPVEPPTAPVEHKNTSSETLHLLATDENPNVRIQLAENPNTPEEVLEYLTHDDDPLVLTRAQDNLEKLKSVTQRADEMFIDEKFKEAEDLYKKLIQGLERLLGSNHQEVAAALHKLAAALVGQNKMDEAVIVETRANSIAADQKA